MIAIQKTDEKIMSKKITKTKIDETKKITIATMCKNANIANNAKLSIVNDAKKLTFTIAELSKRFGIDPKRSRRILRNAESLDLIPCKRPKSKKWTFDIKYENAFLKLISK